MKTIEAKGAPVVVYAHGFEEEYAVERRVEGWANFIHL